MQASNKPIKRKRRFRREDIPLFILAAPAVIWLLIFAYGPMAGVIIAFQNFNSVKGIFHSAFVGLKNFEFLFTTSSAFIITRNTVLYNLVFIAFNIGMALLFAMMLTMVRNRRSSKVLQTVYMLPFFLSYAVLNIVVYAFLNSNYGVVNGILSALGQPSNVNWYFQKSLWPPLLVFINAWRGVGYQTVLFLAVISGISKDYYEAALIDGATTIQQARYITLPHLRFIVGISIILASASLFRGDFGLFYVITRNTGTLYPVTDVIDTFVYRGLTTLNNLGMTTAVGLYQSVVGLILVIVTNKIVKRIDPDSAMF